MNRPSKCKNCQWYGKPYWSITNPCDNCPNEKDYKTIIQLDGVPIIKETLNDEKIKESMESKSIIELILEKKDKKIERLTNGCKELEQQIDDLHKLETTLTNENERLNNIINELEKELKEGTFDVYFCSTSSQKTFRSNEIIIKAMILDKLKELKEGK